jgi:hypothetical protein
MDEDEERNPEPGEHPGNKGGDQDVHALAASQIGNSVGHAFSVVGVRMTTL